MFSKIKKYSIITSSLAACYGIYKFKPVNVVWDLDHTIVKTYKDPKKKQIVKDLVEQKPFVIESKNFRHSYDAYTRPYTNLVIPFLSFIGCTQYVYTAAVKEYGDIIIDELKIKKYLNTKHSDMACTISIITIERRAHSNRLAI